MKGRLNNEGAAALLPPAMSVTYEPVEECFHITPQEANVVKRLRSLEEDGIILLVITRVNGRVLNLAVVGEGKRETV